MVPENKFMKWEKNMKMASTSNSFVPAQTFADIFFFHG